MGDISQEQREHLDLVQGILEHLAHAYDETEECAGAYGDAQCETREECGCTPCLAWMAYRALGRHRFGARSVRPGEVDENNLPPHDGGAW